MFIRRFSFSAASAHFNPKVALAVAVLVGGVAVSLLTFGRATGFFASLEAENAILSNGAVKLPDSNASGGQYIRFGSADGSTKNPKATVAGNLMKPQLVGVSKSGSEYACAGGWGFFDGPVDDAQITLMSSWNINAVRIPLNEHCWLARNGVNATYAGENYKNQIKGFVERLNKAGLIAILDLHWTAAGNELALGQAKMPNVDHSIDFWDAVAREFKDNPGVVFELFNEPHDVSWQCWRNGCAVDGWQAAGMQTLTNTVRNAGATQPVIVNGLNWGGDLSRWLEFRPDDPAGQLAAGWHQYDFGGCMTEECWNSTILPVTTAFPVVASEIGQSNCESDFVVGMMKWLDGHGMSFLAWTWNDWSGCGGPSLLKSYDGTPSSNYGLGVRDFFTSR